MTPLEFLTDLWQYKPEEQFILIWTLQDKRSRWFTQVAAAAEYVAGIQDRDAYVGVGLAGKDHGPTHRCVSDEITGLAGLGSDFDLASDAHPNKALPKTIQHALTIVPAQLLPSIVIATGNGIHCWWLFKEPYIFDSDEDRRRVQRIVARFHTMLSLSAAKHGWVYDRLSDLARVLRIAGTANQKDPKNPKPITAVSRSDRRYNLSDIEEFLDETGIPDPEAQERAAREWAERFADKPLVIDLTARIPDDKLNAWMAEDMRFRNTWLRQRHDLKDQSESGYDLALACFGVDAGLSEQQIVDLIIHHRSGTPHQRTRLDYFQRTISKACKRTGQPLAVQTVPLPPALATVVAAATSTQPATAPTPTATPPTATPAAVASEAPPGTEDSKPRGTLDPESAKAELCAEISRRLGIHILRLVKYTGKEPTYLMFLGCGIKIEFASVSKLISQEAVRTAIAAATDTLIRKIKPKEWEPIAQLMLQACVTETGPEEMSFEGSARMYVTHYLKETGRIPTIEGQTVQNARKPIVKDGKIVICTSDLQNYVNKTTFQNLTARAIASMLGAIGAESGVRIRGSKFKEQVRWALPVEDFDPEEYYPDIRDAKPEQEMDDAD